MKKKLSNSFSKLILMVLGLFIITSCGERKSIKKVEELTKKFYAIAQAEHLDSLALLYPDIDLELFKNIYPDGEVYIDEVKPLGNNKYKVEVYPNIIYFAKNDSSTFGYIITDSEGFVNKWSLPKYMESCGSIKGSKKYTDIEYKERYLIAREILMNKCQDIAYYVNQNVVVRVSNRYANGRYLPLTDNNRVYFSLENRSNIPCLGFNMHFRLAEYLSSTTDLGLINGFYGNEQARLEPGQTKYYSLVFNSNELIVNNKGDKQITGSRFEMTPEGIWNYCRNYVNFTGNEYEEYIEERDAIVDEIEDNSETEISE